MLVARVEFRELTSGGRLRAPSFKRFRVDKEPLDCLYADLVRRPPPREGGERSLKRRERATRCEKILRQWPPYACRQRELKKGCWPWGRNRRQGPRD